MQSSNKSRRRQDRPHPVHRLRRLPPSQALRPVSRTARKVADPGRIEGARPQRLPAHPDEPEAGLIKQCKALLETEGVTLDFDEAAIDEIAPPAEEVNTAIENIEARRLHTIRERLLEEISFAASDRPEGTLIDIDRAYVRDKVGALAQNADLSRFIL